MVDGDSDIDSGWSFGFGVLRPEVESNVTRMLASSGPATVCDGSLLGCCGHEMNAFSIRLLYLFSWCHVCQAEQAWSLQEHFIFSAQVRQLAKYFNFFNSRPQRHGTLVNNTGEQ